MATINLDARDVERLATSNEAEAVRQGGRRAQRLQDREDRVQEEILRAKAEGDADREAEARVRLANQKARALRSGQDEVRVTREYGKVVADVIQKHLGGTWNDAKDAARSAVVDVDEDGVPVSITTA